MKAASTPADLTAAALNLPRSARLRIISALLEKEGDEEAAADYEAAARAAEMDEDPARFEVSAQSHAAFIRKLKRELTAAAKAAARPQARVRGKARAAVPA